jgi:PleD family two-component response regulator
MPYAVITEADLGDRTGFDLCREIKKEPRLSSVPVIFVSADSGMPERAEAVRSGSDAFIAKPLVPEALLESLQLTGSASPKVPVRVLAVEDDAVQIAFLRGVLENVGFIFEACANPEGLFDALDSFNSDIMILDVKLPRYSGYELARILRQDESYMTLPIIFLTVNEEDSGYIEGLKAGSDDYLIKPVSPQLLINCVRYRSKRSLLMRTLTDQDGLTRLLNRASLMRHLESIFSRAGRYEETLSVAVIDIGHFKGINDTHGHQAGDWVLRDLSQFLRDTLRKSDLIGRYGGEEFLVHFPAPRSGGSPFRNGPGSKRLRGKRAVFSGRKNHRRDFQLRHRRLPRLRNLS